jgi:rSAM/selenodomain-associated transferase 2
VPISVIIPTLNEVSHIAAAVESAWVAGAAEVIVVDGGSSDQTTTLATQHGARVLKNGQGRGPQQNCGAAAAAADVLLFLHADCRLSADAGQQIEDALADEAVLGGAFRQQIDAGGVLYRALERGNATRVRWLHMPYGDQGIFMRRTAFVELGGFPHVKLMEDLLLMRAFRRIARPVLLPGPITVSARRWKRHGVIRQTLRNWLLIAAERVGVSPDRLARFYPYS